MRRAQPLSSPLTIMLTSFCVLMLQITVIRILSVVLWYHWAFLSISLAMLGVGAPGVWFSLRKPHRKLVERLLIAAALLVPLAVVCIIRFAHHFGTYQALFCMACVLPPMLALGAVICLLLLEAPGAAVSRIYGFDLLGACLGALLVIPAMHLIATPVLAAGLGLVALLAAVVRRGGASPWIVGAAVLVAGLLVWGEPLQVHRTKSYDESSLKVLHERWTPTARLTFIEGVFWRADGEQVFGWGMGRRAPQIEVDQIWMEQDASAGTPVMRFDGNLAQLDVLLYDVTSLGLQLAQPKRVAVIGAGGGRDVLSALAAGAEHVDAVEINGGIVDALSTTFREFSGDVYHLAGVRPAVSEGRSFLRSSRERYDLIQISLIDSWAATAAGAFALSENNLYTLEAYQLYLARLSDRGMIATSRWIRGRMDFELPRLVALAKAALHASGATDPNAHLVLAEAGQVGTLLIAKRPITDELQRRLVDVAERRGFRVHHPAVTVRDLAQENLARRMRRMLRGGRRSQQSPASAPPTTSRTDVPRRTQTPPLAQIETPPLVRWVLDDVDRASAKAGFDLAAPTDDRPFFFHALPVFLPVDQELANRYAMNGIAIFVLQLLMLIMAAITFVLFFLPFALTRWLRRKTGFWRGSGYFACIGIGFMLIEVPWLQRFILLLEHPSHATTIVLACLLLGAGLGSLLSARLGTDRLARWGLAVPIALGAVNLALPALFTWLMPLGFFARATFAALLLVPLGVPLGFFFPLGMQRFGDPNKAWFWAVNGAFSVLASVVSLALSMQLGFATVTWIGVGAYLAAWLLFRPTAAPA